MRAGPLGASDVGEPPGAGGPAGDASPQGLGLVPQPRRSRAWAVVLVGFLVVGLGSTSFVLGRVNTLLSSIRRDPAMLPASTDAVTDEPGRPVDFLVMGADAADDDQGRSDVLMIAHLNTARDRLYLVSFPRDMYVEIPGHGKNKINAAAALGGPQLAVQTVQELVGIDIEHAAMVDFDGFLGLCAVVGGVDVHNRLASSALGYDFPKGELHLDGEALLAYVRQRDGLPRGDLDRAERQRLVLKALLRKVTNPEVIANPVTFARLTGQLGQYVTVDHRLTDAAAWQLASSLRIAAGDDVITLQAPITGYGKSPNGASIDLVDASAMAELGAALRDDAMEAYVARHDVEDED